MSYASTLTLSVVAPCFNEEDGLPEFIRRVTSACLQTGLQFEIVLVDDGSRDRTWQIIFDASQNDPRIRGVRLLRNHGHQLALTAGLHSARGDRVLAIDADLQDPPELVMPMLELMEREQADVVYGLRRHRAGESTFKRWSAHLFYRLIRSLSDVDIPVDTGDFRLLRRNIVDVLRIMPEQHRFIRGMIGWIGGKQLPFVFDRDARYAGETKYPFRRMLRFAVDAVTGFSRRPLLYASYCGMLAGGCSLGLGVWSLIGWILELNVPGWTSLMAAIALLSALQLMFLGILGEYIGRLYETSRGRPLFLVGMTVGGGLHQVAPSELMRGDA